MHKAATGRRTVVRALGALVLVYALTPARAAAQAPPSRATAADTPGQHDFEFEIGTWVMHRRRLVQSGADTARWMEWDGDLHIVRPIWGGRASLAELQIAAPTPHFAGSILHLFNPQSHQWSLYWASSADATVAPPMVGEFHDGRGEFYSQDTRNGRTVFARVVYSDITPTSFRTEQSISSDGGRTWQTTAVDTYARRSP